jgi:hypothetical protein
MIHCKPKISTYFALGLIVFVLVGGLIYTLNHFATQRTFGLLLYLFSTVLLTLVILLLLVKMMAAYKFISAGNGVIITQLPLRNQTKKYLMNQVLVWDEEVIITNKREFKQLTIVFDDNSSFSISNHEHLNYEDFVKYIRKSIPKKKAPAKKGN